MFFFITSLLSNRGELPSTTSVSRNNSLPPANDDIFTNLTDLTHFRLSNLKLVLLANFVEFSHLLCEGYLSNTSTRRLYKHCLCDVIREQLSSSFHQRNFSKNHYTIRFKLLLLSFPLNFHTSWRNL